MDKYVRRELAKVRRHREFPINTCSASRHVELIGRTLGRKKRYAMIEEEPEHVAASMLSVVASLYKARTEIARLKKSRKQR
jgi:hypothetical protein